MRDCPVCGSTDESKAGLSGRDFFVCREGCYYVYHDRMGLLRDSQFGGKCPSPVEVLDDATVAWFRRERAAGRVA